MKFSNTYFQIFGVCLFILVGSGCDKVEPMRISNEIFSLELWSDWEFDLGQGIDTYVGVFTNGDEEIEIDCGLMSFDNLDRILPTAETVYFEETIIDNRPAKIVKNEYPDGYTTLSLYIVPEGTNEGSKVYVRNPNNDDKYIAIFRTFRFL